MEHHASNIVFEGKSWVLTSEITTMWVVMALIAVFAILATRRLSQTSPKGMQNVAEIIVESLLNFFSGILGEERARKYAPFLMTFFLLILCSNYVGLLPLSGMLVGFKAPTSDISVTAALAIIVITSYFYIGIKDNGKTFLKHFFSPMLPMNLLEMFTRPLSLALRLYGNIYAEETVIAVLFSLVPLFVPLPMYFLSILFGFIQAFIFTLLAAVYIEEATGKEH